MTHKQIYELLVTLNLPVAYDHFESNKDISLPFIVYRQINSENLKADGITYYKPNEFEIELVTSKKDLATQTLIEDLLTDNNIPYDTDGEIWDSEEQIYHNFYEI